MPRHASLRLSAPVCSFRRPYAREFFDTGRVPPPSTVYGCLLALVGEEDRRTYVGTQLAIALTTLPAVSTVLRTLWRTKNRKLPPGTGNNRRPDYQELLTGMELAVWIGEGSLADHVAEGLREPSTISRCGGLSLGESHNLVQEVTLEPEWSDAHGRWLVCDPATGDLTLPLWVDHVGSKGTRWAQFRIEEGPLAAPPAGDPRWVTIEPPD